mmetsp:Transcript_21646/g.40799  ORF Transcript_21646/g.40799 Transcript_21646/m.40799 type:complete len:92 (+) Transcript_21646:47-322(+)
MGTSSRGLTTWLGGSNWAMRNQYVFLSRIITTPGIQSYINHTICHVSIAQPFSQQLPCCIFHSKILFKTMTSISEGMKSVVEFPYEDNGSA